jgi:hypothetical protein
VHSGDELLGDASAFCAAFYHIEATPEAGLAEECLCATPCARKSVVCLAKLALGEEVLYLARYTNCHLASRAVHAEFFLVHDEALLRAARPGATLTVFMTYQPCHLSGGHSRRDRRSCTLLLCRFYERALKPRGVALHLRVAYMYRAHWCVDTRSPYHSAVTNAREGLRLLLATGIRVSAVGDWEELIAHCTAQTREAYAAGAHPFDRVRRRAELDAFIEATIEGVRWNAL